MAHQPKDTQGSADAQRKAHVGEELFERGEPQHGNSQSSLKPYTSPTGSRCLGKPERQIAVRGHFGVHPWTCHGHGGNGGQQSHQDDKGYHACKRTSPQIIKSNPRHIFPACKDIQGHSPEEKGIQSHIENGHQKGSCNQCKGQLPPWVPHLTRNVNGGIPPTVRKINPHQADRKRAQFKRLFSGDFRHLHLCPGPGHHPQQKDEFQKHQCVLNPAPYTNAFSMAEAEEDDPKSAHPSGIRFEPISSCVGTRCIRCCCRRSAEAHKQGNPSRHISHGRMQGSG